MHLPALCGDVTRPPGSNCSTVAGYDCVRRDAFAKFIGDYLRSHRLVLHRGLLVHHLGPFAHAFLRLLQEAAIGLALQQLVQFGKRTCAVPDQSDINRISQANALWIKINLDRLRLSRFGIELDVWERRADNQQSVAILHGLL